MNHKDAEPSTERQSLDDLVRLKQVELSLLKTISDRLGILLFIVIAGIVLGAIVGLLGR